MIAHWITFGRFGRISLLKHTDWNKFVLSKDHKVYNFLETDNSYERKQTKQNGLKTFGNWCLRVVAITDIKVTKLTVSKMFARYGHNNHYIRKKN